MNEILPYIRKTDVRSAISWCQRNNVQIRYDGSDGFLILADFEDAYNLPSLKSTQDQTNKTRARRYKPKGNIAKNILKK